MRRIVYLLFIFAPGSGLLTSSQECGGQINIHKEKSGSIEYREEKTTEQNHKKLYNGTTDKLQRITCTWIIDVLENQTVWIEVVSAGKGSRFGIKFGDKEKQTFEREAWALKFGTGRTLIEWNWRRSEHQSIGEVHLRWNTSEDSHAVVTYTHSESDPVSPSPSVSRSVTYTPDIPGHSNVSLKSQSLRGESIRQGGGVSDLGDKNTQNFPQENANNGQETTGAWISDLSGTNVFSDSSPDLSTHVNPISSTSNDIQEPLWSSHSPPQRSTDATIKTSHHMRKKQNETHTLSQFNSITESDESLIFEFVSSRLVRKSYRDLNVKTTTQKDVLTQTSAKVSTIKVPKTLKVLTSKRTIQTSPTLTSSHNLPVTDRTSRLPRSTHHDQANTTDQDSLFATDISMFQTSEVAETHDNSDENMTKNPEIFKSQGSTKEKTELLVEITTISTTSRRPKSMQPNIISSVTLVASGITTTLAGTTTRSIANHHNTTTGSIKSTTLPTFTEVMASNNIENNKMKAFPSTTSPDSQSSTEETNDLSPSETKCDGYLCFSQFPSTVHEDGGKREEHISSSPPSSSPSLISPYVTSDVMVKDFPSKDEEVENSAGFAELDVHAKQTNVDLSTHTMRTNSTGATQSYADLNINITQKISSETKDKSQSISTQSSLEANSTAAIDLSSNNETDNASKTTDKCTSLSADTQSPSSSETTTQSAFQSFAGSLSDQGVQTSTKDSKTTTQRDSEQSPVDLPPPQTTQNPVVAPQTLSTEGPALHLSTHASVLQSSTAQSPKHTTTISFQSQTQSQTVTQSPWMHFTTSDSKWNHARHYFIVKDQPAIIREKTFQVLLQIILDGDFTPSLKLFDLEPFLQRLSGFQSEQVTWHSGSVLQTVVTFQTAQSLSWVGRAESLLKEAGLHPLPTNAISVGGVRVKNITVGGLQSDVCQWLFRCPSGFQCALVKGNATCKSVCHSEYCKHQGICVHRTKQEPICQCPVGEDYWFMGQRCDLRMTRPRLVGMCFGVLGAVTAIIALLSYLTVRRFKNMLMEAKVEQTRSSYRRFNHFDELSARFWGRSWPGSEDSLDNPGFTRSDELLHMRALDRTCCYHDDTLSIVSTYHGSGTHLNTVYSNRSQYGWEHSNISMADGVVDSGKASDLSVCSWPIEPIQWTPFPLLQQIHKNSAMVKASRTRSYCEGMELEDLEKSWTA